MDTFNAYVLRDTDKGISGSVEQLTTNQLPAGDVTVSVRYSSLNYKDGLILNGLGNLVNEYPHIPGIDFVGTVKKSQHSKFSRGDWVIGTGFRVGETRWGGYSEQVSVLGDQLVPLPKTLTPFQAMSLGSAGLTAAIAIEKLENYGLKTTAGEVLITGGCGGVGTFSTALLSGLGYKVVVSTGRMAFADDLMSLGASEVIERSTLNESVIGPLRSSRWAGCIDSVGGPALTNILKQMNYGASVASVGLAGGSDLATSVIPFLLRGINLLGIDSVYYPVEKRYRLWEQLDTIFDKKIIETVVTKAGFANLTNLGGQILKGGIRGRVVIEPFI